jgi:hypothetical protein
MIKGDGIFMSKQEQLIGYFSSLVGALVLWE